MPLRYYHHSNIAEPNHADTIMRYMPMWKILDIVRTKQLPFCRADLFSDEYEGIPTKKNEDLWIKGWHPTEGKYAYGPSHLKNLKRWLYLSCWSLNNDESEAMWKLYTARNDGVLLKTNYGKLKSTFSSSQFHLIGVVKYIDHRSEEAWDLEGDYFNDLIPFFHKRSALKHEHELRILIDRAPGGKIGGRAVNEPNDKLVDRLIGFDVNQSINEVITTPFSDETYYETVKDALQKYGVTRPITPSTIYTTDFFKKN